MENFEAINFLSLQEREKIYNQVHGLKEHWILRGNTPIDEIPHYTLGAAAYLDGLEFGLDYYHKIIRQFNPILWENFEWLYTKTQKFFEEKYQVKCEFYTDYAALPGFHIFLEDFAFEIELFSKHVDIQHRFLNWGDLDVDLNEQISFTAYVKLPALGGGMKIWEERESDFEEVSFHDIQGHLKDKPGKYTEFQEGQIVIHDGQNFHQIAPYKEVQEGDERLSFQGHIVKSKDHKTFYFHW